jgi:hypothetical protein
MEEWEESRERDERAVSRDFPESASNNPPEGVWLILECQVHEVRGLLRIEEQE